MVSLTQAGHPAAAQLVLPIAVASVVVMVVAMVVASSVVLPVAPVVVSAVAPVVVLNVVSAVVSVVAAALPLKGQCASQHPLWYRAKPRRHWLLSSPDKSCEIYHRSSR